MCNFAVKLLESVRSNGRLKFYKLLENGKAQIDSFSDEVCADKKLEKDFNVILAFMNIMAENDIFLPKEKVNSVKDGNKEIAIEFKKNDLRVYCVKIIPKVFVVFGGYKKNQKNDIKKLKRLLKEVGDLENLEIID